MPGLFITFEGGEGAGKSTQIKRLADHFRKLKRNFVLTREPGGTPVAEELRNVLVNGEPGKWSSTAEALLNYAARDEHLRTLIRPALAAGKVVLCDRFMDSTRAYQGVAGDCPMLLINQLEQTIVAATRPDLTFIFDLDPDVGLARAKQRGAGIEDRYEKKGIRFHRILRQAFLDIIKAQPSRCIVINAERTEDEVWTDIQASITDLFYG